MLKQPILVISLLLSFLVVSQTTAAVTTGQVDYYGEDISIPEKPISKPTDTPIKEEPPKKRNPTKQLLLQASDSINYFFSIIGLVLIFIALYEIKKPQN